MKLAPAKYPEIPEVVLFGTPDSSNAVPQGLTLAIPEIQLKYVHAATIPQHEPIVHSQGLADFFRKIYPPGELELQEQFFVVYLNRANYVIGYYRHSRGGISSTIIDVRLVLSAALKAGAVGMAICHNHPSGSTKPSPEDHSLTKKLVDAARLLDLQLMDHIILTHDSYTSFSDQGLMGVLSGFEIRQGILTSDQERFVQNTKVQLDVGLKLERKKLNEVATLCKITDKTELKELTELAIVLQAREIASNEHFSLEQKYKDIVELYNNQVNLSHRTSQSMLLQQYSTPAPIGFLAGIFCGIDNFKKENKIGFEPSAGNGLLTVAGQPETFIVNEIDKTRNRNLSTQHFKSVFKVDATKDFTQTIDRSYYRKFDAVITNPPFGRLNSLERFEGYPLDTLEQVMAVRAVNCMKDNGKAAIIIGGHTKYDTKGRMQAGKNRIFFNYLYRFYNVADVIPVNGKKLYSRQGTGFDVRLILIAGRKQNPQGAAPLYNSDQERVVCSFDELFRRVLAAKEVFQLQSESKIMEDLITIPENEDVTLAKYMALKKKYPEHIVLVQRGSRYYTFFEDATKVVNRLNMELHNTFNGRDISYTSMPAHDMTTFERKLKVSGYNTAIVDAEPGTEDTSELITEESKNSNTARDYERLKKQYPGHVVLFRKDDNYYAFYEDAEIVAKDAGGISSWIDIGGKKIPMTFLAVQSTDIFVDRLRHKGHKIVLADNLELPKPRPQKDIDKTNIEKLFGDAYKKLLQQKKKWDEGEELGAPYLPVSESCTILNTVVPDAMDFETREALKIIKEEVGGDIDEFVRQRLKYYSKLDLCRALSAEQTDAVAMAIYNIEARNQGMIIGDQTGVGKGRIAAAIIRYAVMNGHKPVFITEKPNLFSDFYRDLKAIGSGHLVPFIVNARESKTEIKDDDGNVLYNAMDYEDQKAYFEEGKIPEECDFVMATYTQFNSAEKKPLKPNFLFTIAVENIFVLDESHNASGSSNTGNFLQGTIGRTKGVVFLSATYAKRPDNMPIYAMKTAIRDANMSRDKLVKSIKSGGVALQEILSSQLVKEGQLIRRERSFEGVEVNYITLEDREAEHRAIADSITEIMRDIISFQENYVDKVVDKLDSDIAESGEQAYKRGGTNKAGVDNLPYFSKVFQVINQMLFSIKAEAVADRAIQRLAEGKKPIIAFSSTMGSFIEQMENEAGQLVKDGDLIDADFTKVLTRGLEGILRYTVKSENGEAEYREFDPLELGEGAEREYLRISEKAKRLSSGISISPIDVIVQKLSKAGYRVAEVTGRKFSVQLNPDNNKGIVHARKKVNTNDAFRKFQNNEIDVLLINQSGSTGASAHAIVTKNVPADQVKQRVMIILQPELEINTEVQKRGRIHRTAQIFLPIYDYVMSAIPAEKRLLMLLQKKLKSLDANTTSNQKQSTKIIDVPDFLNEYGDKVVKDWLSDPDNKQINKLLGDPLNLIKEDKEDSEDRSGYHSGNYDAALKVTGRVAVLSTDMQEAFYEEISESYNNYVEYLKQIGEYNLEVETLNLQAETISRKITTMGKGGESEFGTDSILEKIKANVLRKPFKKTELENIFKEALNNREPKQIQSDLLKEYEDFVKPLLENELSEINKKYEALIKNAPTDMRAQKINEKQGSEAYWKYVEEQEKELTEERDAQLEKTNKVFANRQQYLSSIFKFFNIGRNVLYPFSSFEEGDTKIKGVFLGFMIDRKKNNPFTPSKIRLRFALANSAKYVTVPASYFKEVEAIMGASHALESLTIDETLENWEADTKASDIDRSTRFVVTGNLLQAFARFGKGKLVSYTTKAGETVKGILLPEYWEPKEESEDKISVPVGRAVSLFSSLVRGSSMITEGGVSVQNTGDDYKIIVPGSRSKGGDMYLDQDILALVDNGNFEKTSDKMVAHLAHKKIGEFLGILQDKFNDSVNVTERQFMQIKNDKVHRAGRAKIKLLTPEEAEKERQFNLKVAFALAKLKVEAELQKYKNAA